MIEDTDLLPWILGGMLALAAVAAAALSDPAAPPTAPVIATASTVPAALSAPSAAHPAAAQVDLSPVIVTPTARQQLPPGQVWECDVDGRRVFSDTLCGAHATVRRLTEVNVIDSSTSYARVPPRPHAGDYPPSGPGYDGEPAPASDTPPDDSDAGYPIYTGAPVVVARDRRRRDHLAHRANHTQPRAARP